MNKKKSICTENSVNGERGKLRGLGKGLWAVVVSVGLLSLMMVLPWVVGGQGDLQNAAGVDIVKSAAETIEAGEIMTYTIVVTNGTGDTITDTLVSDLVPSYTTFLGGSMSSQAGVLTATTPVSITAGNGLTWTIG